MDSKSQNTTVRFQYTFKFENGEAKVFDIVLDANTLELVPEKDIPKPEWARLDFFPCEHCPLAPET